jgi:hypothetical protein
MAPERVNIPASAVFALDERRGLRAIFEKLGIKQRGRAGDIESSPFAAGISLPMCASGVNAMFGGVLSGFALAARLNTDLNTHSYITHFFSGSITRCKASLFPANLGFQYIK